MSNEDQGVAPLQAAEAAYDGPAGSLLRIAESLESEANTASRSGQTWSLKQLAQELRGAHGDVTAALRRLQSDLAAREENLKCEAASWKDITNALSQQAAEAKRGAKGDHDYIEWLCERLDESNAEMRKYRHACWDMAKKQTQDAAQPPSSEASPQ